MSAIEARHSHLLGSEFLKVTLSALKTFADRIAYGRRLYRDYVDLSAMSDLELQDLGIRRSDIFAVVAGTYQRAERPPVTSQAHRLKNVINQEEKVVVKKNKNSGTTSSGPEVPLFGGTVEMLTRRHSTLSHLQKITKEPKSAMQARWEHRWLAASGAWFAVLLALLLGGIDWRGPVMVAAIAFMLARGGDMLDDVDKF